MNKKTLRIAGWALGLSMAVAGIGATVGATYFTGDEVIMAKASSGDSYSFSETATTSGTTSDTDGKWSYSCGNTSGTAPAYNAKSSELRLYPTSYITFTGTTNVTFTKATFTCKINANKNGNTPTGWSVNNGDIDEWTGSSTSFEINDIDNNTFTLTIGSGGAGNVGLVSVILEYSLPSTVEVTSLSGLVLSKTSVPENYGKPITATASFLPLNANEELVWESSNPSVATIADSDTLYGVANVTIVGQGECVFTVKAKHDSGIKATAPFSVTEAVIKHVYDVRFMGSGANDGTTDLSTGVTEKMLGDVTDVNVTAATKIYNGKNGTIKLSSGSSNGSMTMTVGDPEDPESIKGVIIEAIGYAGDTSSISVKPGSGTSKSTGDLSTDAFVYYTLMFDSATNGSLVLTATKRSYIRNIVFLVDTYTSEQGEYSFAANLLNSTASGCASLNANTLATAWSTLGSSFSSLDSQYAGSEAYFKSADALEDGNVVEKAAARYDFIVGKYLKTLGNDAFVDFAERDPSPKSAANPVFSGIFNDQNDTVPFVVTLSSVCILASTGIIFLLARKRRNED